MPVDNVVTCFAQRGVSRCDASMYVKACLHVSPSLSCSLAPAMRPKLSCWEIWPVQQSSWLWLEETFSYVLIVLARWLGSVHGLWLGGWAWALAHPHNSTVLSGSAPHSLHHLPVQRTQANLPAQHHCYRQPSALTRPLAFYSSKWTWLCPALCLSQNEANQLTWFQTIVCERTIGRVLCMAVVITVAVACNRIMPSSIKLSTS